MNATKPPLQPQTHPKPLSRNRHIVAWTLTILFVLMAAGAAYLLGSGQNPLKFFTGSIGRVESMSTVSSAETTTPTTRPAAAPVSDPAAANLERQSALGAYAAAYRATAVNGFYSTVPTEISVSNIDPATAKPYEISTAVPAAVGQIRYWPGGNCTGAPHVPGSTGTKFLALQIKLEGTPDIYCLQVNQP
ncbi:MAG: hypothetical protein NVS3B29_01420 [Candidatus Saccharimonadales bacterium]